MKLSRWDRVWLQLAPGWALGRIRNRAAAEVFARHFEAAMPGRRTSGWARSSGDADVAARGAIAELRMHSRDLIRNNGWARNARRIVANNTVGWGIVPKPVGDPAPAARAMELWHAWADATTCESEGRHTFAAVQKLVMKGVFESGEMLIRRRWRRPEDGLPVPMQIQILEPDYLDSAKEATKGDAGGPIIQGIEYDMLGRRAAYWLFFEHPGSGRNTQASRRVSAADVLHIYDTERAGQTRGVSWLCAAILKLKDFDGYEDATLLRQKIAACFAAFVTDVDGARTAIGEESQADDLVETFEPGMIAKLPPGKDVTFGNPPAVVEDGFTVRTLRSIAAAIGITYEDMTGDYSQVNYSSARMGRIAHRQNVDSWRWDMLIPLLCDGVWGWFMEALVLAGDLRAPIRAEWTPPPLPMLDPDKEGLAYQRLVRIGAMTHDEMIREQGGDPETHWREYADGNARRDELGLVLDSDPRQVTASGQAQSTTGAPEKASGADVPTGA